MDKNAFSASMKNLVGISGSHIRKLCMVAWVEWKCNFSIGEYVEVGKSGDLTAVRDSIT